jgi:hypothetical protein
VDENSNAWHWSLGQVCDTRNRFLGQELETIQQKVLTYG